jgi:hypothetical protein
MQRAIGGEALLTASRAAVNALREVAASVAGEVDGDVLAREQGRASSHVRDAGGRPRGKGSRFGHQKRRGTTTKRPESSTPAWTGAPVVTQR